MHWNVKQILNKLFFTLLLVFLSFFFTSAQSATNNLEKEMQVIEKLNKEGVLTKEE